MNGSIRSLLRLVMLFALLVPAAGTLAGDRDVSYDSSVDFRAVKTFAIRSGQIDSRKAEIDNRLFRLRMEDSIRTALVRKGLREAADHADVLVTYSVQDKNVATVERHRQTAATPELYTEGVLVIDFTNASGSLLWRGTWHDQEQSGPSLSRKLSEDAGKLLAKFPPKGR